MYMRQGGGSSPIPHKKTIKPGTTSNGRAFCPSRANHRRGIMPVLIMWAVPAVIVIGGVGYWLVHMH